MKNLYKTFIKIFEIPLQKLSSLGYYLIESQNFIGFYTACHKIVTFVVPYTGLHLFVKRQIKKEVINILLTGFLGATILTGGIFLLSDAFILLSSYILPENFAPFKKI